MVLLAEASAHMHFSWLLLSSWGGPVRSWILVNVVLSCQNCNTEHKGASKELVVGSPHLFSEFDLSMLLREYTFQYLFVAHRINAFHIRLFYLIKRAQMFLHLSEEWFLGMRWKHRGNSLLVLQITHSIAEFQEKQTSLGVAPSWQLREKTGHKSC